MMQSERLNTATRSLLGKIEATNTATLKVITDQFNFVLRHALGEVPVDADADEAGGDQPFVGEEARRERERLLESWQTVSTPRRDEPSEADAEVIQNLDTFPPEDVGLAALQRLDGLPYGAVQLFRRIGSAERVRRRRGHAPWSGTRSDERESLQDLVNRELVKVRERGEGRADAALTELGHQTAPVLIARPPAPDYLRNLRIGTSLEGDG